FGRFIEIAIRDPLITTPQLARANITHANKIKMNHFSYRSLPAHLCHSEWLDPEKKEPRKLYDN
ncbi:MAG TPA: hypothetical protein QF480_05895, partial [Bacteroidales bacterium]|nr:hypothetical protein [Bacteroidales bacterium]